MQILITGGAGYLGSHLVPELLSRGHQVCVFDRFCFVDEAPPEMAESAACEIIRGDIRRLQEFPGLMEDVDAIIHLAGLANEPSCALDPAMAKDVVVECTRELANQAVQNGVGRLLFASTCGVYGLGVFEQLDEESPASPVTLYAESKLEAEQALSTMEGGHFEPVIARLATLYGWSPRMRFDLAIHWMVATASRRGKIEISGRGDQVRPFIHVRDASYALADLIEAPSELVAGEIFNVGLDDGNLRILDLGRHVAKCFDDVSVDLLRTDEDQRRYRISFEKLRQAIDFKPRYTIDGGIEEIRKGLEDGSVDPFEARYDNTRSLKRLLDTPVEDGGEPIASRFIPLAKPSVGPEEERAVIETLRSGWLTSGPHVAAFERSFAEAVDAPHAVAVSSCTAALHLCLVQLGVEPGDEVITSPLTYASVGNLIVNMGARPVFADIHRDTLNIDPASIEKRITERTKAIIPVHMAGEPCDLEGVYGVAQRHGVAVVEDAAHAVGASYKGTPIGSYGDFACFSFYAIKNITTMEGGMVTVNDAEVAKRLSRRASHGMLDTAWERYGRSAAPAPQEVFEAGYKYQMTNVSAAMGLEQLKKLPRFQSTRRRLARLYRIALRDVDEVGFPEVADEAAHAWHLMIVRFRLDTLSKNRDEIAHALRQENVGTGFHFWGLHLHEFYRETFDLKPEDLPEATAASHEVLSLPLHPGMTDHDVYSVVAALKKVIAHARKA